MNTFYYSALIGSILFLNCNKVLATNNLPNNSNAPLIITRTEYQEGQTVPVGAWNVASWYYTLQSRNPNQVILMSMDLGAKNSVSTELKMVKGSAVIKTSIIRIKLDTLKFTANWETNGVHNKIEYIKQYPSDVMYSYYQSGISEILHVSYGEILKLDYLAPYKASLTPSGKPCTIGFGWEKYPTGAPFGRPFLMINGKRHEDDSFNGVQFELSLIDAEDNQKNIHE